METSAPDAVHHGVGVARLRLLPIVFERSWLEMNGRRRMSRLDGAVKGTEGEHELDAENVMTGRVDIASESGGSGSLRDPARGGSHAEMFSHGNPPRLRSLSTPPDSGGEFFASLPRPQQSSSMKRIYQIIRRSSFKSARQGPHAHGGATPSSTPDLRLCVATDVRRPPRCRLRPVRIRRKPPHGRPLISSGYFASRNTSHPSTPSPIT